MSNNVNVIVSGPNNNATSQYKTLILKSAKTFKEQVTLPNTKYVIRYDFDLNGETITIPTGSILEFDGGMVSNGTLVGQNTKILNLTNTDSLDVTLEGTFEDVLKASFITVRTIQLTPALHSSGKYYTEFPLIPAGTTGTPISVSVVGSSGLLFDSVKVRVWMNVLNSGYMVADEEGTYTVKIVYANPVQNITT